MSLAQKCLALFLRYMNYERNNRVGTTLIIKADDTVLICLHLTFFFHLICSGLQIFSQWVTNRAAHRL